MRQLQIVVLYLDPIPKCQLQLKGAMAIYMGARPFGLYNCAYMKDYIVTANSVNIPPYCRLICGELLIACYEKTRKKIVPRIASKSFLSFTTDGTSNIHKEKVQNLCVVIP